MVSATGSTGGATGGGVSIGDGSDIVPVAIDSCTSRDGSTGGISRGGVSTGGGMNVGKS